MSQANNVQAISPVQVTLWAVGVDFDDAFQPYFSAFDEEMNAIAYASDQSEGARVFSAVFGLLRPSESV